MNIKLFVDSRIEAPDGWLGTTTITEAIRILSDKNLVVEQVSLDFDIASNKDYDLLWRYETFEPVARYIAGCYLKDGIKIIIHTANSVGAKNLSQILEGFKVEVRPYTITEEVTHGS